MSNSGFDAAFDTGIHTEINVIVNDDHVCLFPTASSKPDTPKHAIIFNRSSQVMNIEVANPYILDKYSSVRPAIDPFVAYGVLGFINLYNGLYVMLIKQRSLVGLLDGHCIYKVTEPSIIRISNKTAKDDVDISASPSNIQTGLKLDFGEKKKRDENYVRILRTLLKSKDFYFSYTMDLSNTLQRKNLQPEYLKSKPLWMRVRLKESLDPWPKF